MNTFPGAPASFDGTLSGGVQPTILANPAFGVWDDQPGQGGDAVETYFNCITTCSLEDGECITRCVEQLRDEG